MIHKKSKKNYNRKRFNQKLKKLANFAIFTKLLHKNDIIYV